MCVDDDGDGYGLQCDKGPDCDDEDPAIFKDCRACAKPNQGCSCEADTPPVDCTLSKEVTADGTLLCKTGTRYCRDGEWSGCEGIRTFAAPPPSNLLTGSLIDPDAGLIVCSSCSPDCYQIEENPGADSGQPDGSVVSGPSGGITIASRVVGADGGELGEGGSGGDGGLLDDLDCVPGTAPDFDCDGIPDEFDPLPGNPPFSSDHNTIFMDLGPGDTQEESFEVRFYLNTADIYFYLDMTGSMDGERANLISSLRTGNYMTNGGAGVECADRNFNGSTADEAYLKNEGIAGNLACLIRDSRIGTGWHRDLPLPKADSMGHAPGPHDFEAFQHEQDITADISAVSTSLGRFATRGGLNRPEGGIVGLYALATGAGIYMGWNRPGNLPRTDCGAGRWGYPCFRDDAVPIVIWMTDAPISNGPAPAENQFESTNINNLYGWTRMQPVNWEDQTLRIETGTDSSYVPVGKSHESFATALDLGDVSSSFKTYFGDTTGMTADVTYQTLTGASSGAFAAGSVCESGSAWSTSTQTAPDAVFKFTVTEEEPITVSTRGSRWRTSLAIVDARRLNSGAAAHAPTTGNALPAAPYNLGTLDLTRPVYVSGTTSGATAAFTRDALGCLDGDTSSSDKQGAVVVKFNLPQDVSDLRVSSDMGGSVATSLFRGRPGTPTDISLSSTSFIARLGTGNRTGNSNDEMDAYSLGDITGSYLRFTGGSTSDADITAQYPASMFTGVGTCGTASGVSSDAVWDFSLSAPTRLRIETMGDNDTLAAGFNHMVGLIKRTKVAYSGISGNVTDATARAINLSDLPGGAYDWLQYSGTLSGAASTYLQSEVGPLATPSNSDCNYSSANSGGAQAVFVVDVPSTRSLTFDTSGTATTTWLSLHQGLADTQQTVASSNSNNAGAVQALGAIDEVSLMVTGGNLASHNNNAGDYVNDSMFGCASANGGRDAIYSFTVNANQTVNISAVGASGTALSPGTSGFNARVGVFRNSISAANRIGGSCTDPGGNNYEITNLSVAPGNTYYVVVKSITTGTLSGSAAQYGLWLRDTTFNSHFLECDYGSQLHVSSARAAKITRTLSAGRHYLVVKGASGGSYQLNVRPTPSAAPTLVACDRDGAGTRRSVIERDLTAGDYTVVLRGVASGDRGQYQLALRDMGVAPAPVSCVYDGNAGVASALQTSLPARDGSNNPIDYYLVMRGNSSTGSYSIWMESGAGSGVPVSTKCAYDNVTMTYSQSTPVAYTSSTDINNAEWTGTLPVGEYYAVLKGYDMTDSSSVFKDNDYGMYQLTIGDQTNFEGTGLLDAKRWLGPSGDGVGGVREALLKRQIRVIMVDSTSGSGDNAYYSDQQMRTIAEATGAVALDGSPLFFKINQNGTGLGTAIVEAVNQLAGNLAMDVGVRLVEAPDSPAPKHFNFRVEAIDVPGDLCQPPVDTDNDAAQTPDTHVKCTPGAVPRFKVTVSNPSAPNNVPPNPHPSNPSDTRGGYEMRLELIGDGQYVVDQIPIYIIPEDVVEQAGETRFEASGVYEQTIDSNGCFGNEAPLWRDLSWAAQIPDGTSLTWNVCTADTEADLARCSLQLAAAVQTGGACINNSNCPVGYCNASNVCEMTTGPVCSSDSACGINGSCVSGFCRWSANPIDVKPALARSLQGKRFARVQVVMTANSTRTVAPTIYNWGLKYTCTAQE